MASSAGYIIACSCEDIIEDHVILHLIITFLYLNTTVYFIYACKLCIYLFFFLFLTDCSLAFNHFWRQGKGDYFQGVMFLAELSTPSVCLGKILIQYKQQHTLLHKVNGALMLVTFFICRVLLFPYLYYAYGRYASIPFYMVPLSVPWQCNAGAALLMAPQVYWFSLICRGAFRLFTGASRHKATPRSTDSEPKTSLLPPANGYSPRETDSH
uniref:Protein FAM57B-like n=1 Tax=Sinocyclocheilus grahami TaxID=75366 RepID=A0A672RUS7_SINGR